ncbi:MAG: cytochrome c biogenesis protein CcsA [Paludibacter sp.]|jgi:hypothetical protein|nr:cytochrome c biogenesis protein CcsA [Paludibacter sp.]
MKISRNIAFISLFVLIAALAAATIIEKFFGTETALSAIYHSWWFIALWGVCAIAGIYYLIIYNLHNKIVNRKFLNCKFIIHLSLIIILAGAFTSFLTSKRGFVHIRQGEILNYFLIQDEGGETARENLPFDVKLLMFSKTPLTPALRSVPFDKGDNARNERRGLKGDFFSYLQIDGKTCCVYLNHIYKYKGYRFYQYEYDSDERGVTLLVNRDPAGIAITYAGYLLLLVSALWLLWKKKLTIKGKHAGLPLLPIIAIPTAAVWFFISQIKPMTPVLRSPMLAAHVSVIMVSYVLLLIIAVLSAIALIKEKRTKSKEKRQRQLLPEKQQVAENFQFSILNSQLLFPAVFLLAIGIFIGAVWANISWGRYWGWDSKETWALITLLVYAVPFHKKTFPKFQDPKFFHRYLLIAFLTVLMTFLGVSFLLGGMHSYL